MSESYRRYELLLPLRFNDGQPIPDDLIADCILEIREQFGPVSCESQTIRGWCQYQDQTFRDELVRIFVDVRDDSESHQFFLQFKERLKTRFQQVDIWMTSHPIEVL